MTRRTARTHRRPPAARTTTVVAPATPPAGADYAAALLQATRSRPWACDRDALARLQHTAEARGEVVLPAGASVAPADHQRLATFLAAVGRTPLPASIDCRVLNQAPTTWVRFSVLVRSGPRQQRQFAGIVTDISPMKALEAQLLQISEREQNRIGQELHDDLCQVLAGLSCLTRVLENRLSTQVPHEVDNLREINQQLVEAMDRTRALTHGLFPAKMRSGDARPVLQELARQVAVRFGVKVHTSFRGRFPAHTPTELLHVYRVAQEAISNAIRHGRANRIALSLERTREAMCLSIEDNGTGFPPAKTAVEGIGLQIMHHRADQLGAKIVIGNAPRRGASVVLRYQPNALPL